MSKEQVYLLDTQYAGKSREEKIREVRAAMEKAGANVHLISSMDDIVWLLNIRGNDIVCNPVVMSYVMMDMETVKFYVQEEAVSAEVRPVSYTHLDVYKRQYLYYSATPV